MGTVLDEALICSLSVAYHSMWHTDMSFTESMNIQPESERKREVTGKHGKETRFLFLNIVRLLSSM